MTVTLTLTRHAEASFGSETGSDHDRRLTGAGAQSAQAVGVWLQSQQVQPDHVICSTAFRAVETWEKMSAHMDHVAGVEFLRALYLAESDEIWRIIQSTGSRSLLIVGHNPGLGLLAHSLPVHALEDPRSLHYPTAATTVFRSAKDTFLDCSIGDFEIIGQSLPN